MPTKKQYQVGAFYGNQKQYLKAPFISKKIVTNANK